MEKFGGAGQQNKKRSPENYTEKLKLMLEEISSEINGQSESQGLGALVNPDCTISMDGYLRQEGSESGIFNQEEIEENKDEVFRRELNFSGANILAVQNFYRETYGINDPEGIIEHWKKSKEKNKNGQTEMAITALLHKILKQEFLVVRSSAFDDYVNGTDNLILNKETGEAICAFDEVHEGGEGERTNKKIEKVKKVAMRGGTSARYGIGAEKGKLKRTEMKKIPIFYLGLDNTELAELLEGMEYSSSGQISDAEYKTFHKLISSLHEQMEMLLEGKPPIFLPPPIKTKLSKFAETLNHLETLSRPQSMPMAA